MNKNTESTDNSDIVPTHFEQPTDKQESHEIYKNESEIAENQSLLFTDKVISNIVTSKQDALNGSKVIVDKTTNTISCRSVLWYLAFVGFAINYMIRININIAIVDMIFNNSPKSLNGSVTSAFISECYNQSEQWTMDLSEQSVNSSVYTSSPTNKRFSFEREILKFFNIDYSENGFDWNESQQGLLLGSFYWLHWLTQVPGGILARKYGTKLIFGSANFIGCIICAFIPILSFLDLRLVLLLRTFQGLILGLAWPSMHHLTAQWIPPNERSRFVSAYLGSSVGIAVFFPVFGYVIALTSWEWVFHLCFWIGLIWFCAWQYFVYDSPNVHPRIDPEERDFIEKSLGGSFQHKDKIITPWKQILTSRPVWLNVISQFGGIWALFTLMTQAPTYFKTILGWEVRAVGLLSGFPHLSRMIFAYYFSVLSDYLLRTEKMSRTNVRKLAGTFCNIINGIFLIALAYSGCNSVAAIVFLTISTSVHGAVSSGPLASVVDLSPNFSGILLGINGMVGVLPGFISPYVVGKLTLGNQNVQQWQYVFLIAATLAIFTGILYLLYSESNLQSWNSQQTKKKVTESTKRCNAKFVMGRKGLIEEFFDSQEKLYNKAHF